MSTPVLYPFPLYGMVSVSESDGGPYPLKKNRVTMGDARNS